MRGDTTARAPDSDAASNEVGVPEKLVGENDCRLAGCTAPTPTASMSSCTPAGGWWGSGVSDDCPW